MPHKSKNKGKGKVVREFPVLEVPPSAGEADDVPDIHEVFRKLEIATRENERMKARLSAIDAREEFVRELAEKARKDVEKSVEHRIRLQISFDRERAEKIRKAHADYDGKFGHICTDCFEPIYDGIGEADLRSKCVVGCEWHCSKDCHERSLFFKDCGDYQNRITEYPQMRIDFQRISDELMKKGCFLPETKYGKLIDWKRIDELDLNGVDSADEEEMAKTAEWMTRAREYVELEECLGKEINELCYSSSACRYCGREYCAKTAHGASANWNVCPKCCECCIGK